MKLLVPNIDFDLSLGPSPKLRDWSHWARHFFWAQSPESSEVWDGLCLKEESQSTCYDEYTEYLASLGLKASQQKSSYSVSNSKSSLIYFGGRKCISDSVLSAVNSKKFWALRQGAKVFEVLNQKGNASDREVESVINELKKFLNSSQKKLWMLKQSHGNGGWGNLRCSAEDVPENWVKQQLQAGMSIVVEPWRKRVEDWGSSFFITEQGRVTHVQHYQVLNTSRGGFLGIGLWPSERMEAYKIQLEQSVQQVSESLFREGYWGPAQIDHFVWKDEQEKEHLQTPVEVNARYSMSIIPFGVQQKFPNAKYVFWRLFHSKNFSLPQNNVSNMYEQWTGQLGELEYKENKEEGVLLTTPFESSALKTTSIGVAWLYNSLGDVEKSYQNIMNQYSKYQKQNQNLSETLRFEFLQTKSVEDL